MAWTPGNRTRAAIAAVVVLFLLAAVRSAADGLADGLDGSLAPPKGEVLLTVTGAIARTNAPDGARLDRATLESLGLETLQTSTPWTDGAPVFKGVPVSAVLDLVQAKGERVRAVAANDYTHDLPVSDFRDYPVLLAIEMNGQRLKTRDKGPIWIVYPIDQFDALKNRVTERKMVWQLKELRVR